MKSFINENMVLATQIENADAVEDLESILCKSLAQAAHMFKRGFASSCIPQTVIP